MIPKLLRSSWSRKLKQLNSNLSVEEKRKYYEDFKKYFLSLSEESREKIETCFFYHSWRNVLLVEVDSICLEYLPYYKWDALKEAKHYKKFFKQWYNWKQLDQEHKDILNKIISYFYDLTLEEIYKEFEEII